MNYLRLVILVSCCCFRLSGQTGPNSASVGVNNASTGTNAWTNPANVLASDNAYATVSTKGNSNYLLATGFGFAIASPANIDGIQLDVEKKEATPSAISILDGWSNGLIKTISPGSNRCLVVVAAIENGNSVNDITGMTYGGVAMTQALEITSGTTTAFSDRLEVWILLESGINAAGGSVILPTYAPTSLLENVEFYTSVVLQNVDQSNPVYSSQSTASNSSANPHQLAAAFNTLPDGMCLTGVICGNNTTPALTTGGTNTYTINSSFVEGTDIYTSNPSFSTSGISIQTATKACTVIGTEQPTFTFAGSVNRAAMFGLTFQRARATDNAVYLVKAGAPTGSNLALVGVSWPASDAYVSYGGPTQTWGASWTTAEVNNAGFGAAISASMTNGNLHADHFRITIYSTSTLPIELLEFTATAAGTEVQTHWVTATEQDNDYFVVERTADGVVYETVGTIDGAGNSTMLLSYDLTDAQPLPGTSYYRLKQVDFNGAYSYSPLVAVNFSPVAAATVYPNPAVGGVFTFLQEGSYAANEVAVFSENLTLVKKVTIAPGEKAIISLADQADGIYFLVYDENGTKKVSKVQKLSREK